MKSQKEFIEFGKEQLEKVKQSLEELEVQINLGTKEAKERFEHEMKNFQHFVNEQKAKIQKDREVAGENLLVIVNKLEELEKLLTKKKPEKKASFSKLRSDTLQKVYELEFMMKEHHEKLTFGMRARVNKFKHLLDEFRLALALSTFENSEEADKIKVELKERIEILREKVKREEEGEGKVDHFVEELSASFDHLKKAFKDLF